MIQILDVKTYSRRFKKGAANLNTLFCEYIDSNFNNQILIYTDGSKKESAHYVGSAIWCASNNFYCMYRLPPEINIYWAECFAVLKALNYAHEFLNQSNFLICTDSLAIISAIKRFPLNKKTYYLILEILDEIKNLREVGKRRYPFYGFLLIVELMGTREWIIWLGERFPRAHPSPSNCLLMKFAH